MPIVILIKVNYINKNQHQLINILHITQVTINFAAKIQL